MSWSLADVVPPRSAIDIFLHLLVWAYSCAPHPEFGCALSPQGCPRIPGFVFRDDVHVLPARYISVYRGRFLPCIPPFSLSLSLQPIVCLLGTVPQLFFSAPGLAPVVAALGFVCLVSFRLRGACFARARAHPLRDGRSVSGPRGAEGCHLRAMEKKLAALQPEKE